MYRPITLIINDFGSFEDAEINFSDGRVTLIQGKNLSDIGSKSNGSGKSHFAGAIYYALVGSAIDKKKRDIKLIRRGAKEAFISLTLRNDFLKHTLRIERTIPIKGSSTLDIYINDELQRDRYENVNAGNKLILELLDISANDLQSYYLINSDRFISFFNVPDSQKKDFIGKFSGANSIRDMDSGFEYQISIFEEEIKKWEQLQSIRQQSIFILEENLNELKNKDYKSILNIHKEEVKKEKEQREQEKKDLLTKKTDLIERKGFCEFEAKRMEKWYEVVSKFSYDKTLERYTKITDSLNENIGSCEEEVTSLKKDLSEWEKKKSAVEKSLAGTITCPKCGHKFNLQDKDFDYNTYVEFKELINESVKDINEFVTEINKKITDLSNQKKSNDLESKTIRKKIEKKDSLLKRLNSYANKFNSNLSITDSEIKVIENKIKILEEKKDEDKNITIKFLKDQDAVQIKSLEDKVKAITEENVRINAMIEVLSDKREERISWKSNFKQFYTYLINKSLMCIESSVNSFLQRMNTNLSISIEGYKLLANGKDIRENINILVRRNGFLEDELSTYSMGEKGRLICAMILANQYITNQQSKSGGLDLLIIDEILDAVDSLGMQSLIQSMQFLNQIIFVITHIYLEKTEDELDVDIMTIVKENAISRIEKGLVENI